MKPARSLDSVSEPLAVTVPDQGVVFAESIHGPQFSMQVRKDGFYKLIYVLEGRVQFSADGMAERDLGKGAFFPVPVNVRHSIEDKTPATLLLLCLGKAFIESDPQFVAVWQRLVENYENGASPFGLLAQEISSAWKRAILEQMGVRFGRVLSIRTTATSILLLLARISADEGGTEANRSRDRIRSFAANLEKTFFEDWNLDKAAAVTRLSRKQFTKLFKEVTGMTFLEKLTQLRMAHACSLLSRTDHSVLSIAFSCGYQDLSHFYRLFKRTHGASPIKWRKE